MGVVTPLGSDLDRYWMGLISGVSPVAEIRGFDASNYPTRIAAEIHDSEFPDTLTRTDGLNPGRKTCFAFAAAQAAFLEAGLDRPSWDSTRASVVIAPGFADFRHNEVFSPVAGAMGSEDRFDDDEYLKQALSFARAGSSKYRDPGHLASEIAQRHGIEGSIMCVDTACAASAQALEVAVRWIRRGSADIVLAGGADSMISPLGLASFCQLRVLSRRNDDPHRASRPFDADRDGFVLGEGAGMLVIEDYEHASRRGAPIRAELVGVGSACDAYRATDPHPDGRGAIAAMSNCLEDAAVDASRIGYINAHGTSTRANDRIETAAIRSVFGPEATKVTVSSTKSSIGHLTEAAGAVEAIATILSLQNQIIHPTINYTKPDPECNLDYVPNAAREAELDYALSNSFGFGGQCTSLLFKRC